MTSKEYLQLYNKFDDVTEEENKAIKNYNRQLTNKYPWLVPKDIWTGEVVDKYDYDYTQLDDMPDGWRVAFGLEMQEDIKKALLEAQTKDPEGGYEESSITTKYDSNKILPYIDGFRVTQIKEKYGKLHFYCNGAPEEVYEVIFKYENKSSKICIDCGKPAKWISRGWISPYCDNCAKEDFSHSRITKFEDSFINIEEFFKQDED